MSLEELERELRAQLGPPVTVSSPREVGAVWRLNGFEVAVCRDPVPARSRRRLWKEREGGRGLPLLLVIPDPMDTLRLAVVGPRESAAEPRSLRGVDLELLKLADPGDEPREELPESVDLDALWQIAVEDICAEHNAALDPAARERRLPASQRWALDLLRDPSLPDRPEFSEADGALLVPRDAAVLRSLADIRRRLQGEELTPLQAAEGIATVVQEFGLRPAKVAEAVGRPLTPGDIGVVVYQVVLGEK